MFGGKFLIDVGHKSESWCFWTTRAGVLLVIFDELKTNARRGSEGQGRGRAKRGGNGWREISKGKMRRTKGE